MALFGDNLKKIRKEKGLTQQQLGDKLGCSKELISQYERGKLHPKTKTVANIAKALGVSYTLLNFGTEFSGIDEAINSTLYEDYTPLETSDDSTLIDYTDTLIFDETDITKNIPATINEKEMKLLEGFNNLTDEGQDKVISYTQDLNTSIIYVKQKERKRNKVGVQHGKNEK